MFQGKRQEKLTFSLLLPRMHLTDLQLGKGKVGSIKSKRCASLHEKLVRRSEADVASREIIFLKDDGMYK